MVRVRVRGMVRVSASRLSGVPMGQSACSDVELGLESGLQLGLESPGCPSCNTLWALLDLAPGCQQLPPVDQG